MSSEFDPYRKWLGIPPEEQPANHYQLLGVGRFEDDAETIEHAADQRMAHLRNFQTGQHSALSQKLLNEVAAARVTLLSPEKKAAYDSQLRQKLARAEIPRAVPLAEKTVEPELAELFNTTATPSTAAPKPRAASAKSGAGATAGLSGSASRGPIIAAAAVAGVLLLALLVWAISGGEDPPPARSVADLPQDDRTSFDSSPPSLPPVPAPPPNRPPTPPADQTTPPSDPPPAPAGPTEPTAQELVEQGKVGENLIKPDEWVPRALGFEREGEWFVCDNGDDSEATRTAKQTIWLNQTEPRPIYASLWSKSQDVGGRSDANYALLCELQFTDGSCSFGNNSPFEVGTHDWQRRELVVVPEKPIASMRIYTMFRKHTGKAWFRDAEVRLVGEPPAPKELTPQELVEQGKVGENLIRSNKWGKYHLGYVQEGDEFVCDNGNDSQALRGIRQDVALNQTKPEPVVLVLWSKAENVDGTPGRDYSLLYDIKYVDGSGAHGPSAPFDVGTHDWQRRQLIFTPAKPVAKVAMHGVFRNHTGKVWFRDAEFRLIGEPPATKEPTAEELVEQGKVGENLLKAYEWMKYGLGFDREGEAIVCDNGNESAVKRGGLYKVMLNQTEPRPIVVSLSSKAESVGGTSNHEYAMDCALQFTDGSNSFINNVPFEVGTHDWQRHKLVIVPEKPIEIARLYALFRNHPGKAWFRDAELRLVGEPAAETPSVAEMPEVDPNKPKLPVPDAEARSKVTKQLEEVYELSEANKPERQLELAHELRGLGEKSGGNPAEQFVLLQKAMELAGEAGNARLMVAAIDEIAKRFEIDPLEVKTSMLEKFAKGPTTSERIESFMEPVVGVIDRAVAEKRFDLALKLAERAYRLSQKTQGRAFRKEAYQRRADVIKLQQSWEELQEVLAKLEKEPDNAEANLTVGRWYCFDQADWARGLPHLAKSSDAALKSLAAEELSSPPSEPAAQIKLADAWWDLAQSRKATEKTALLLHAGSWYQEAQAGLTSVLLKDKVKRRLEEIGKLKR